MTEDVSYAAREDSTMAIVCYALYLAAFLTGITAIVGVVIAYAQQNAAGPAMRSHYTFLIRTFWIGLALMVATALVAGIGAVLSVVLIGIPILFLAGLMGTVTTIWFAVRCIIGLVNAARGDAYPRPYAILASFLFPPLHGEGNALKPPPTRGAPAWRSRPSGSARYCPV